MAAPGDDERKDTGDRGERYKAAMQANFEDWLAKQKGPTEEDVRRQAELVAEMNGRYKDYLEFCTEMQAFELDRGLPLTPQPHAANLAPSQTGTAAERGAALQLLSWDGMVEPGAVDADGDEAMSMSGDGEVVPLDKVKLKAFPFTAVFTGDKRKWYGFREKLDEYQEQLALEDDYMKTVLML